MKSSSSRAVALSLSALGVLFAAGCGQQGEVNVPPSLSSGGAAPGPGGAGPGGGGGPSNPKLKELMGRLAKGPASLTPTIGKALEAEKPDWTALEPQTKEYVKLVGDLTKEEPAKGSKESWATLSAAYLKRAEALDKAVVAKNVEDAKAAHGEIAGSCMACHREHRAGGPMGGGPPGGLRGAGGPAPEGGPPGRYNPNVPSNYPGMDKKDAGDASEKKEAAKPAPPAKSSKG